ncbi:MAG: hypothetical protein R2791_01950 [Saprospiraceae bacterium]
MKTPINPVLYCATLICLLASCTKQYPEAPTVNAQEPLQIDIYHAVCIAGGESLIVYEKEAPNFDTYNNAKGYAIEWWDGDRLLSTGTELTCVCGMKVRVIVKNLVTGQTGQMEYQITDCYDKEG